MRIPDDALEIEIFAADHTAWSKKLNRVVMMREAEDHTPDDYAVLSGTRLREMLSEGMRRLRRLHGRKLRGYLMEHYQQ